MTMNDKWLPFLPGHLQTNFVISTFRIISLWKEANTIFIYSWPLNNAGVRGTDLLCSWKSTYNFEHPPE